MKIGSCILTAAVVIALAGFARAATSQWVILESHGERLVDDLYFPEGFPEHVIDRNALIKLYSGRSENGGRAEFTDGIVFYTMFDPLMIVCRVPR